MTQNRKEHPFSSGSSPFGIVAEPEPGDVLVGTLADRMSDEPSDPTAALPMLADIAECVDELHVSGKQHATLSPATISFTKEGNVRIRSYVLGQTQGTITLGGAKYTAPDVFRKTTQDRDFAITDIYVLGFIFYEFLLGRALFRREFSNVADGAAGWVIWHSSDDNHVKSLTELIPGFPAAIAQIVEGMLEKDPVRRTKDLNKIATRLRNASDRTIVYHQAKNSQSGNIPDTVPSGGKASVRAEKTQRLWQEIWTSIANLTGYARKRFKDIAQQVTPQQRKQDKSKSVSSAQAGGQKKTGSLRKKIVRLPISRPIVFGVLAFGSALLAVWLWRFGSDSSSSLASSNPTAIQTDSGEMVCVHGREITVGTTGASPNDTKMRTSYLEPFYIDRYQVSNRNYRRFCLSTGRLCPDYLLGSEYSKHADEPVLDISSDDARAFAEWAGKWLPSVAEWRAAMATARDLIGISRNQTTTATNGSALEWTESDFRNSIGEAAAGLKIIRANLRTSELNLLPAPSLLNHNGIGFRCVTGLHILETAHFLGKLSLPMSPYAGPQPVHGAGRPTSVAAMLQPALLTPETPASRSADSRNLALNNDQPSEPQGRIGAKENIPIPNQVTTATERIPFTITGNVPDAAVLINGQSTKFLLFNGSRQVSLPPGKYRITLTHDNYNSPPEQLIELKNGDAKGRTLTFSATPRARTGVLSVESAPAETEVVIDSNRAGIVGASGAFTTEVPAGNHTIILRKQRYEALAEPLQFSAGNTVKLSGAAMKPFGAIALNVSPINAHVTLHRAADAQELVLANNTTYAAPAGEYLISVVLDRYISKTESITVTPGKIVSLGWELKAIPDTTTVVRTPMSLFEDSLGWRVDPARWWVHDAKGYTFLRAKQGTFAWHILRDTPKGGFFKSKGRKVSFVAEYKNEDDRVLYTLDSRRLTKRVYSAKRPHEETRWEIPEGTFSFSVQMTSETVLLKTSSGQLLDSVERSGEPGKFGFLDEVWLSAQ